MMDSEIKELRKRKAKRVLIWIAGITAATLLVITITILSLIGGSSS